EDFLARSNYVFSEDFIYCNILNRQIEQYENSELLTVTFAFRSKVDVDENEFAKTLEFSLTKRNLELLKIIPFTPETMLYFIVQICSVSIVGAGGLGLLIVNIFAAGCSSVFHSLAVGLLQVVDIYPDVYAWYEYNTDDKIAVAVDSAVSTFLIVFSAIKVICFIVTLFLLFAKDKVDNNEDKCLGKTFSIIVENNLINFALGLIQKFLLYFYMGRNMIPGSAVTNAFWLSLLANLILFAAKIIEFFAGFCFPKCGCDECLKFHKEHKKLESARGKCSKFMGGVFLVMQLLAVICAALEFTQAHIIENCVEINVDTTISDDKSAFCKSLPLDHSWYRRRVQETGFCIENELIGSAQDFKTVVYPFRSGCSNMIEQSFIACTAFSLVLALLVAVTTQFGHRPKYFSRQNS
ncbi:unnamed protein product, partial [Oikopleura dioica]